MKLSFRRALHVIASAAAFTTLTHAVLAQDWPTHPVTMVVPYPPGGPLDTVARILGARMGELLGQPVIIENVGGAGGMIGSARVARAAPDGYQMLMGNSGTHTYNQSLYKKPLYNAVTDFEPVALVAIASKVLVVRKDFPANTLSEFITYVKANEGKLQYGSAGVGSANHITCVLLNSAIGIKVTHVPYRGAAPAMQDLVAGRIDYMCDVISTSLAQIKAGTIKPIAMLTRHRAAALPDVETADEQGLHNFAADTWNALFAPKGTPAPILSLIAKAASDALNTPAVRQRFVELGLTIPAPAERDPEYLAKLLPAEIEKWAAPIKAAGISPN
jgi:tripartite-type tricarboxylate transporter receptor subunit TctC